jgi:hypothetical protein
MHVAPQSQPTQHKQAKQYQAGRWSPLLARLDSALTGLAIFFLFTALVFPFRLDWFDRMSYMFYPLELFLFGLVLLIPGRSGYWLRILASMVLAAGVIFRIADIIAYQVFSRPFNPVFDTYLLADAMNFLTGSIGRAGALFVALCLVILLCGIILLSFLALRRIQLSLLRSPRVSAVLLMLGVLVWLGLSAAAWPRASRYFYDQLAMHVNNTLVSIVDMREFREVVEQDIYKDVPGESLFGKLQNKDVLMVFVESYGRTLMDKEEYSQHFRPALEQATATLTAAGFEARSAFMGSPTVGGISWLAHGTALSGLWIDSQVRYNTLMMSERPSLVKLFQRAGWRTVGVMPAITMPWPEGSYFGYDQIYTAPELDYRGLPYNFVTMPDQFTLSRFQEWERGVAARTPIMAEIALVSSHAPWTPVPTLIGWDAVGDGSIFSAEAASGDPAEVVWQDRDRVLRQYRQTVEYVIDSLVSYTVEFGDDELVLLIIGDHQPMPYVTDNTDNRDVLVHVIARDPAVMQAMDDWRWSHGMLPQDSAPVWRMDALRDRFIETFSDEAESNTRGR